MRSNSSLATLAIALTGTPGLAQEFSQSYKLSPPDESPFAQFGAAVAVGDGIVAVGSRFDETMGTDAGAVFLYEAETGAPLGQLYPDDGFDDAEFGVSVAIGSGYIAVGAWLDDEMGLATGAVYVFDVLTKEKLYKIFPDDSSLAQFGHSVAIDNGILAVGAPLDGAAILGPGTAFSFQLSTGAMIRKLTTPDVSTGAAFGRVVDIDNGVVAVGAFADNTAGLFSGSAFLFDALTGNQLYKLVPDDIERGDRFGSSIAIENGLLAVGAVEDDVNDSSGSVYLFEVATGDQGLNLNPSDGAFGDFFGASVAVEGDTVIVGSAMDNYFGGDSGSAYLFSASTGAQVGRVLPEDGLSDAFFGSSVAVSNGVAVIGAPNDSQSGLGSGSAYVFGVAMGCSVADLAPPIGALNFDDILAFLSAFTDMDPAADLAEPFGALNFDDVLAFLNAFAAGCP
ncbi:MAG: GC-type dockerin domain-anchored protein [Phycisphaerales bacterium JB059]